LVDKPYSVADILASKGRAQPLVCLTAYDQIMARLVDQVADLVLVGDSLAMVAYGQPSTLPVTLDIMIAQADAPKDTRAHGRSKLVEHVLKRKGAPIYAVDWSSVQVDRQRIVQLPEPLDPYSQPVDQWGQPIFG
jgi:hypothetical protein